MSIARFSIVAFIAVFLAACAQMQDNPKQTAGTLVGAGLGALAGSQFGGGKGQMAAVAIGALGGAWLGGEAGKSLDRADKAYAQRSAQQALEHNAQGQTAAWRNPDTGHWGSTTPVQTYRTAAGEDCRLYETNVTIDGRTERATGRACRQADGTWRVIR
jgi:surface antigen